MKTEQFQQYAHEFLLARALAQAGPLVKPRPDSTELRSEQELTFLFREAYEKALNNEFNKALRPVVKNTRDADRKTWKKAAKQSSAERLSSLTLVDNDALGAQLKIDRHGRDTYQTIIEPLQFLSMRMEAMSGQELEAANNPLHPGRLGHCFRIACEATSKNRIAVQSAIDRWLALSAKEYGEWLNEWNAWLIKLGVLPALDSFDVEERYLRREEELARSKEARKEIISSITGKPAGENDAMLPTEDIMRQLSLLIKNASANNSQLAAHTFSGNAQGPQASYDDVMEALSQIKALDLSQIPRNADTGYVESVPSNTLADVITQNTALADKALDDQTQSTVSLLSMLFERFQADDNIAPPIRTLISSLQVPMLQSALSDPSFLIDSNSPAQQMLNEIGKLGAQWSAKPNANKDVAYQKLEAIVSDIQEKAHQGENAFEENLEDLQQFVKAEDRKATLLNQRAVAAEQARARIEAATRNSQQAITDRINHLSLPMHAAKFIQDSWQKVLFFFYNQDPDATLEPTRQALSALDALLDAAQGKATTDIDALVQDLTRHLHDAGRDDPASTALLTKLGEELAAIEAVRQQQASVPQTDAAVNAVDDDMRFDDATPMADEALHDGETVNDDEVLLDLSDPFITTTSPVSILSLSPVELVEIHLDVPEAAPEREEDTFDQQAAALYANSWFMYRPADSEQAIKLKLAAIIKHNHGHVFVNREGAKVLSIHRTEVADKLRSGELQIIENAAMFERTLANIIGSMRQ
ncbi:MAG TPA: DUF1631 family protein [Pseudomonadales bacterium]